MNKPPIIYLDREQWDILEQNIHPELRASFAAGGQSTYIDSDGASWPCIVIITYYKGYTATPIMAVCRDRRFKSTVFEAVDTFICEHGITHAGERYCPVCLMKAMQ